MAYISAAQPLIFIPAPHAYRAIIFGLLDGLVCFVWGPGLVGEFQLLLCLSGLHLIDFDLVQGFRCVLVEGRIHGERELALTHDSFNRLIWSDPLRYF